MLLLEISVKDPKQYLSHPAVSSSGEDEGPSDGSPFGIPLALVYIRLPSARSAHRIARHASITAVQPSAVVTTASSACDLVAQRAPLVPAPALYAPTCHSMSGEGSASPDRLLTGAREYGSTPWYRTSHPASANCCPSEALQLNHPTTPEDAVEFEPPKTVDTKLQVEDSQLTAAGGVFTEPGSTAGRRSLMARVSQKHLRQQEQTQGYTSAPPTGPVGHLRLWLQILHLKGHGTPSRSRSREPSRPGRRPLLGELVNSKRRARLSTTPTSSRPSRSWSRSRPKALPRRR